MYIASIHNILNAAVSALSNHQDFDRRLINAGRILQALPSCAMPDVIASSAVTLARAFTHYPLDDVNRFDGTVDAVIRSIPESRKARLPELVHELYRFMCEGSAGDRARNPSTPIKMSSGEKWEYLQWNLPFDALDSEKEMLVRFAQAELPAMPADVLLNWASRSASVGYLHALGPDLADLEFVLEEWSTEQLSTIHSPGDSDVTEVGSLSAGDLYLMDPHNLPAQHVFDHGTWDSPIIVLSTPNGYGRGLLKLFKSPPGFMLLDGRARLSSLLNLPRLRAWLSSPDLTNRVGRKPAQVAASHKVWVARMRTGTNQPSSVRK